MRDAEMTLPGMSVVPSSHTAQASAAATLGSAGALGGWYSIGHTSQCKLMKKHVELARKSCRMFQHATLCESSRPSLHGLPSHAWSRRPSDLEASHRRSLHNQHSSGGSEQLQFRAAHRRREDEERARSKQGPVGYQQRYRSSSTGLQAANNRAPSASLHAPNNPAEALRRSQPINPAHSSHQYASPARNIAPRSQTGRLPLTQHNQQGPSTVTHTAFTEARPAEQEVSVQQPATDVDEELRHASQQLAQLVSGQHPLFRICVLS